MKNLFKSKFFRRVAIAITGIAAFTAETKLESAWNYTGPGLWLLSEIGDLAGVNKTLDTYANFCVVEIGEAGPGNLHRHEWKKLRKEYGDQPLEIVRAVQDDKNSYTVREFVLAPGLAGVVPGDVVTFKTTEQYLKGGLVAGLFSFNVDPIVQQEIKSAPVDADALERYRKVMIRGQADASFKAGWFGPTEPTP